MSFVKVKVEKNESSKKNGKWEEKNIIKQIKEVVRERKEGEE